MSNNTTALQRAQILLTYPIVRDTDVVAPLSYQIELFKDVPIADTLGALASYFLTRPAESGRENSAGKNVTTRANDTTRSPQRVPAFAFYDNMRSARYVAPEDRKMEMISGSMLLLMAPFAHLEFRQNGKHCAWVGLLPHSRALTIRSDPSRQQFNAISNTTAMSANNLATRNLLFLQDWVDKPDLLPRKLEFLLTRTVHPKQDRYEDLFHYDLRNRTEGSAVVTYNGKPLGSESVTLVDQNRLSADNIELIYHHQTIDHLLKT